MEPENGALEKKIPIGNHHFQLQISKNSNQKGDEVEKWSPEDM